MHSDYICGYNKGLMFLVEYSPRIHNSRRTLVRAVVCYSALSQSAMGACSVGPDGHVGSKDIDGSSSTMSCCISEANAYLQLSALHRSLVSSSSASVLLQPSDTTLFHAIA
jgi:hypothetical protein